MMELVSLNQLAKELKLGTRAINSYLKKAKQDNEPCFIVFNNRIKIIKDEFIKYMKNKSMEEFDKCQKNIKMDFTKEGNIGGLHTTKMEQDYINQLNARLSTRH